MLQKLFYVCASFLLVSLAFVAVWIGWQVKLTNEQLRSAVNEIQWVAADARPELRETLKQAKLTSFEMRAQLKALAEDINSREQQRARLATMRAGESVAALAARIEADTLPLLNQNLRSTDGAVIAARGLLENTDRRLTGEDGLLPESTRLLSSLRGTADAFQVDSKALSAELLKLTQQGQVSMTSINAVLASPEWLAVLKNVERSTANIADTTAAMPATAESIEKILATAEKWQRPMLVAGMLATLARAFIP